MIIKHIIRMESSNMKKSLLLIVALALFVFLTGTLRTSERVSLNPGLPESPPFIVSNDFDGQWEGRRIDISGDKICLETRIIGTIENGNVLFRLMYNSSLLKGWISEHGELELYSDSPRWGYRFSGAVTDNRIEGDWMVTNAPCHGTWFIEKTR